MLWNWNTVDSCFIASSWRITSNGIFALSCIGVVLLVMALELLRRAVKEYDRFLIRKHLEDAAAAGIVSHQVGASSKDSSHSAGATPPHIPVAVSGYRPTVVQQAIRAFLHMVQFAVAYFVMLLAMYYNGYIIICIFIGAFLGSFVFQWEKLGGKSTSQTSAANEATVCCG
jgi:copper transporter 1